MSLSDLPKLLRTLSMYVLATRRSLIILVGLTMTWFSEKLLISTRCLYGFMPNLDKKSWMVFNSTYSKHKTRSDPAPAGSGLNNNYWSLLLTLILVGRYRYFSDLHMYMLINLLFCEVTFNRKTWRLLWYDLLLARCWTQLSCL